jgi:hypothetical protein
MRFREAIPPELPVRLSRRLPSKKRSFLREGYLWALRFCLGARWSILAVRPFDEAAKLVVVTVPLDRPAREQVIQLAQVGLGEREVRSPNILLKAV